MKLSDALARLAYAQVVGPAALRVVRVQSEWQARGEVGRSPHLASALKVAPRCKEMIARHWLEGRYAAGVRKVAWVTSGAPVEFLTALGYFLVYPENHAAICGTARVAVDLCQVAEAAGYSRDLCSYVRTDLGSLYSGRTPVGRLPRPDLLVACTNICQTVLFWYRVLADHFRVPLVIVDTPFVYSEQATDHALQYAGAQIDEAIAVAEHVAGRTLRERTYEAVALRSRRATELWLEIMQQNGHIPAPISAFDQFVLMAPIVEMRGQAQTIDFYAAMLDEVDARLRTGVAAVPGERFRVLWDNLPIWYRLRAVAEMLAERGIAVVASTYTNAWGELAPYLDPEAPRESMIRAYTYPILNRGSGHKLRTMQRMIEDYHLDGVILHSDRSCKPYSLGQMDQRDHLAGDLRRPALLLEADHNDSRCYTDEQAANRLAAFAEMMEARA
jgi:benzoyl-CoA reductase/2-hydroxyglutaryl-CoA dehydratase subunit BcrC/BadD/HgdB